MTNSPVNFMYEGRQIDVSITYSDEGDALYSYFDHESGERVASLMVGGRGD